jgi:6-phosphofructokinase 1
VTAGEVDGVEMTAASFAVRRLGEAEFPSPMRGVRFVRDDERVLFASRLDALAPYLEAGEEPPAFEVAGPRERLFFDPARAAAGIVTCGGLCPGLNDVIRALVMSLHHHYGVRRVIGFQYGYEGLVARYGHARFELTPAGVSRIHEMGGSVLGSSRGEQDVGEMVDTLELEGVDMLFAIGGDGTLRGAHAIAGEVARRGSSIAVVAVPKTIDNDISFIEKSFGFETAVSEARRVTYAAHSEAAGARNGVGLVKLMGRDSGFIAAFTVLADSQVNFCLVPEVPFTLSGFLAALEERLASRGHAVVVVAEGAGAELFSGPGERDASGNVMRGDIGLLLRDEIRRHFAAKRLDVSLKYIDPSYTIRSLPASAHDSAFCLLLGHSAVHAAMAGRTDMVVGFWRNELTDVPIALAVSSRKKIDPAGALWSSVLSTTGQPHDLT